MKKIPAAENAFPSVSAVEDLIAEAFGKKVAPEVLLAEIDDLLRSKPTTHEITNDSDNVLAWIERFKSAIAAWNPAKAIFVTIEHNLASSATRDNDRAYREIMTRLHEARNSIRLNALSPLSVPVEQGKPFDYFDGLRKIIEAASAEIFFVDQYLDAEFAGRYLPLVPKGVSVRLLADQYVTKLAPAVEMFVAQTGAAVEVRAAKFHDRFIFVDRKECYHSGASFKDGAKNTPTLIVQITDAFDVVARIYEEKWASGNVIR